MIWNNQMAVRIVTAAGDFYHSINTLSGYQRVYNHPDNVANKVEWDVERLVDQKIYPDIRYDFPGDELMHQDNNRMATAAIAIDAGLYEKIHEFD